MKSGNEPLKNFVFFTLKNSFSFCDDFFVVFLVGFTHLHDIDGWKYDYQNRKLNLFLTDKNIEHNEMADDNYENDYNTWHIHHCWIACELLIQHLLHFIPSITCYNHKQCHHICLKVKLNFPVNTGHSKTYGPTAPGITSIFWSHANIFRLSFIK